MSATTLDNARVTPVRVLNSEWIKLRTLRSTVWTLIIAVVLIVLMGPLITLAATSAVQSGQDIGAPIDPVAFPLAGTTFGQLAIAVLGVLMITGEYSTGMIRASFAAVPKRLPVLWSKMAVLFGVVFVLMLITDIVAFLLGQLALKRVGMSASLTDPTTIRAVVGSALFLAAIGLLGMAIGALIRSSAGAIAATVGVIFVLPILTAFLGAISTDLMLNVQKFLPSNAGAAIMNTTEQPGALAPWPGFLLFCGYIALISIVAAVLIKRRDA